MMRAPWELDAKPNIFKPSEDQPGIIIELVTPQEFASLPDGTALISISGSVHIKGRDYIDDDTRGGMLAYGVIREDQSNRDLGAYDTR